MHVRLITLLGDSSTMGKHLIEHYSRLGVTSFWLCIHRGSRFEQVLDEVRAIARGYDNVRITPIQGSWLGAQWTMLTLMRQCPDDWFIIADHDEFQTYPGDLAEILRESERRNCNYVSGAFVDRVAADGSLAPYDRDRDLWPQYPMGVIITAAICGANFRKVAAAKGCVEMTNEGHHQAATGSGFPISEMFVQVHHFKWVAGVLDYLQERNSPGSPNNEITRAESLRFIRWWRANGGRIPLDEPGLLAGCCTPDYPHWETIRKIAHIGDLSIKVRRIPAGDNRSASSEPKRPSLEII